MTDALTEALERLEDATADDDGGLPIAATIEVNCGDLRRALNALSARPQPRWTDADVERVARAIAFARGRDPDEDAPLCDICTADSKPVPWWAYYEEDARAALSTLAPPAPEPAGDRGNLRPTAVDGAPRPPRHRR